jgi:hypothetical protein
LGAKYLVVLCAGSTLPLAKQSDGWRVVDDDDYRQAVGEPQAEGMTSTVASFSLS